MGLFGDDDSEYPRADFEMGERVKNGTTKRVVDREAGVVLYAWRDTGAEGCGLAAVPIDQTRLAGDGQQSQQLHQGRQGGQPQNDQEDDQPQSGQEGNRD